MEYWQQLLRPVVMLVVEVGYGMAWNSSSSLTSTKQLGKHYTSIYCDACHPCGNNACRSVGWWRRLVNASCWHHIGTGHLEVLFSALCEEQSLVPQVMSASLQVLLSLPCDSGWSGWCPDEMVWEPLVSPWGHCSPVCKLSMHCKHIDPERIQTSSCTTSLHAWGSCTNGQACQTCRCLPYYHCTAWRHLGREHPPSFWQLCQTSGHSWGSQFLHQWREEWHSCCPSNGVQGYHWWRRNHTSLEAQSSYPSPYWALEEGDQFGFLLLFPHNDNPSCPGDTPRVQCWWNSCQRRLHFETGSSVTLPTQRLSWNWQENWSLPHLVANDDLKM